MYHGQASLFDTVLQIKEQVPDSVEIQEIVNFANSTKKGLIGKM